MKPEKKTVGIFTHKGVLRDMEDKSGVSAAGNEYTLFRLDIAGLATITAFGKIGADISQVPVGTPVSVVVCAAENNGFMSLDLLAFTRSEA